jgi:hypothetical protein
MPRGRCKSTRARVRRSGGARPVSIVSRPIPEPYRCSRVLQSEPLTPHDREEPCMAEASISPRCRVLARLPALVLMGVLTVGCASFKASRRLDVGPFAENTVGMIGEVQRATKPVVWTYLKKYESLPLLTQARQSAAPARTLMRGVAIYSTQIVSIYESDMSESRKCQELAHYLDEGVRERLRANRKADLYLSEAGLDSAVAKARAASSFMAALGAAQAVVTAALSYGNSIYDSLDINIDMAAADIDGRIEQEFAPLKQQLAEVASLQMRMTANYTQLARYRLGDAAALDSLRARDPASAEAMPAGKRPTDAALDATEKRIDSQLAAMTALRGHLDQQFEEYRAEQTELDAIRIQARESTRLGRITLITWARSHRNLAAGVKVPASINVMGMVQSAAGKATGIAIP